MKPENFFKNGKVYVWKENFAVIKSKNPLPGAFAVIQDKNEITVVIDQSKVNDNEVIKIENGWKLLTFDMILPFELVGFLAKISSSLADEKISIFVISTYSTDNILVKENDLGKAIEKLKNLGFIVGKR